MSNYFHPLTNPHPRMFEGLELRKPADYMKRPVPCPVCQGHGGWNMNDRWFTTSDGRVLKPTQFGCNQCHGWGYVEEDSISAKCVHEWVFSKNLGNCYNQYVCSGCSLVWNVDSSD